jgi:hypothetical protein
MSTPFKLRGTPFKRNFSASPLQGGGGEETGPTDALEETDARFGSAERGNFNEIKDRMIVDDPQAGSPILSSALKGVKIKPKEGGNSGITKGDGGYSYKIDYRTKEGDLGDGTTDLVYRKPHIYFSKDGGEFKKVETGSDAYKAIKKKHYSTKLEPMPLPKGKKGNNPPAMEYM